MSTKSNFKLLSTLLILTSLCAGISSAYTPDPVLLKTKGFSPETIQTIKTQSSRMEWDRPEDPARSPKQQFLRNIFINDWTGNFDPFGSHKIRERQ